MCKFPSSSLSSLTVFPKVWGWEMFAWTKQRLGRRHIRKQLSNKKSHFLLVTTVHLWSWSMRDHLGRNLEDLEKDSPRLTACLTVIPLHGVKSALSFELETKNVMGDHPSAGIFVSVETIFIYHLHAFSSFFDSRFRRRCSQCLPKAESTRGRERGWVLLPVTYCKFKKRKRFRVNKFP